jgi:hypothetical protein
MPESQIPFGCPGEPDVVLWPPEPQVQRTWSPGWIVTDEGEKTKSPPGPTVTSTVIALAALGYKISEVAAVIKIITRKEKAFII